MKQKPQENPEKTTPKDQKQPEKEVHGYEDQGLLEPTRYGEEWEVKGRVSDF